MKLEDILAAIVKSDEQNLPSKIASVVVLIQRDTGEVDVINVLDEANAKFLENIEQINKFRASRGK